MDTFFLLLWVWVGFLSAAFVRTVKIFASLSPPPRLVWVVLKNIDRDNQLKGFENVSTDVVLSKVNGMRKEIV